MNMQKIEVDPLEKEIKCRTSFLVRYISFDISSVDSSRKFWEEVPNDNRVNFSFVFWRHVNKMVKKFSWEF